MASNPERKPYCCGSWSASRLSMDGGGGGADLRDCFTSIPHTPLMRSLSRRIADGRMLHVTAPGMEVIATGARFRPLKRDGRSGAPRRADISPLLANCYFRRFLLAWHQHDHRNQLDAPVVDYAIMPTTSSSAADPATQRQR